eukprot:m.30088 g.30088  ORF g.30088 m.30088 type:complete len:455 (+) comp16213_c0_seq1:146-1510(+)
MGETMETVLVYVACSFLAIVTYMHWKTTEELGTSRIQLALASNVALSVIAYVMTRRLIPHFMPMFTKANLFGVDLNKVNPDKSPSTTKVPESLGTITAAVYLVIMFLFIPFYFTPFLLEFDDQKKRFPHGQLEEFICGLLSICCMIFLGFADDVLNLRWRHKMIIPTVGSLPLLMVYFVNGGSTRVIMPLQLRDVVGVHVDLGILYYVYMGMLAVFCTNAINILAGINGIEAGQSLVIALSICVHNGIEIWHDSADHQAHELSLFLMMPFVAVTSALLSFNLWPAKCFVGDTFCYFAGMTFAVSGILGHFSKTMFLFFIPQVINFIFSVPQLFKFVHCPRHRLPRLNKETGLLENSLAVIPADQYRGIGRLFIDVFALFGFISFKKSEKEIVVSNFTFINLVIRILGPTHEHNLAMWILAFQVLCSCLAFYVRYQLVLFFFDGHHDHEEVFHPK